MGGRRETEPWGIGGLRGKVWNYSGAKYQICINIKIKNILYHNAITGYCRPLQREEVRVSACVLDCVCVCVWIALFMLLGHWKSPFIN